jgi:peptide/nickel transport system ATP-binding protein/nickel transport system ATP-binding protein
MIEIKDLSIQAKKKKTLLKDVDLNIKKGQVIGLTGSSGSGKSTLVKSIMGILDPRLVIKTGHISVDKESLLNLKPRERRKLCGIKLAFIPQNPMTAFDRRKTIGFQMDEVYRIKLGLNKLDAKTLSEETLKAVNLPSVDRIYNSKPQHLSGGMLQRVSMALIIGLKPDYIMADEPTSALDKDNRKMVIDLLNEASKESGILLVSHDTQCLKALAERVIVMENGCITENKKTDQLFSCPSREWTKEFVSVDQSRKNGEWQWQELKSSM